MAWCADLLAGRVAHDDPDRPPLSRLGGRSTPWLLNLDGEQLQVNSYWARVWGARGLLHCYQPTAAGEVVAALGDDQWRVREMAAKGVVGEGEHAEAVREVADDPEEAVRTAAETSLRRMRKRLDRDV